MKILDTIKKTLILLLGLFLYSLGMLLLIHANLGPAPWEVFQLGLLNHTSLSLGQVVQLVGLLIIFASIALKETPGLGTLANIYFIGYFLDQVGGLNILPQNPPLYLGILMLLGGIFLVALGSYFYINTGWGAGPRDSLMVGLSKVFKVSAGKARTCIEVTVVLAGILLGSYPGLGTIAFALLIGQALEVIYRLGKKDPKTIEHKTLIDNYHAILSLIKKEKEQYRP